MFHSFQLLIFIYIVTELLLLLSQVVAINFAGSVFSYEFWRSPKVGASPSDGLI